VGLVALRVHTCSREANFEPFQMLDSTVLSLDCIRTYTEFPMDGGADSSKHDNLMKAVV
jgi:hypothetical protein